MNIIIPQNNELLLPHGTTLPKSSLEKLARLELELADLSSLTGSTMTRLRGLEEQTLVAEQYLADAKRADNETAQRQHQTKIDGLMSQRRALSPILAERNARAGEVTAIFVKLRAWAEKLPAGTRFAAAAGTEIGSKPVTVERLMAVRAQIEALEEERGHVNSAPPAADELKAKIRESVAALVESPDCPRPDMSRFVAGKGPIKPPYVKNQYGNVGHILFQGDSNVFGLFAWLDPDRLIARLCAEVDAHRNDADAEMTDAARAARLAEIETEILALDRQEEALIEGAKAAGHDIQRRSSASPLALLGIEFAAKSSTGGEPIHTPKVILGAPRSDDGHTYGRPTVAKVAR